MTSAVAAVADPSVACTLALPAEDVASSVAAPARAREVGWAQRAANVLFGAPSARRACGGAETSFTPKVLRNEKWRRRRETGSVFAVDRKGGAGEGGLPRIWVSEPAPDGRGRTFVASYPCGADRGGWRALELAEVYFSEALGLPGEEHRRRRVDCYRAGRDAPSACGGPGQRRCPLPSSASSTRAICARGRTGTAWPISQALHKADTPCDERAYLHFSFGAYHGHGECCWRLGDLVAAGRGCASSAARAFSLYRRAFDLESGRIDKGQCEYGQRRAAPRPRLRAGTRLRAGLPPGAHLVPAGRHWPRRRLRRRSVALQARAHRGSPRGGPHGPGRSRALTKGNAAADGESRPLRRLSKIAAGLD